MCCWLKWSIIIRIEIFWIRFLLYISNSSRASTRPAMLGSPICPIKCTENRWRKVSNSHWWWSVSRDWESLHSLTACFWQICTRNALFPMLSVISNRLFHFSCICRSIFYSKNYLLFAEKQKQTVKLDASTVEIEERGVKLRLTVVDTPGFGDAIDNSNSFSAILEYIDEQYERFLRDESGLNRRNIVDNRIHCCFYFISPFGHG